MCAYGWLWLVVGEVVVARLSLPWAVVARRGSIGFDRLDSIVARLALVVVGLV